MKIVNGFVWKIIEEKQAMPILALNALSIYALRDDDTEYLITDFYELLSAVKKGYLLGIEIGKLTNSYQMEKPKNYKEAKHSGYEIFRIFRSQRNRVLVVMRPPEKMDTSEFSVHFDLSKRFLANIGINILNYCK